MTNQPSSSPASALAHELLAQLHARGLRDVVLSPGSRSQALALAAAQFADDGRLRLHVRIDERVAGFLALGLAVETGVPVAIVTTSGTAVANLHPAVLEAYHSGVPLIVLSADRPEELRGIGANQTTVQPGLFADAVPWVWDVDAPSRDDDHRARAAELANAVFSRVEAGPVQLNLAFREPLSDSLDQLPPECEQRHAAASSHTATSATIVSDSATVVVAGHGAGEQAEEAARALGAPLFAEVSSGAHFGPQLVVAWRALLPELGEHIGRVIVFGHPTLSREIGALVARDSVHTIVVRGPGADDYNPGHRVSSFVDAIEVDGEPCGRAWAGRWVVASRAMLESNDGPDVAIATASDTKSQAAFGRAVLASLRAPVTRRSLVEAAWRMTWPHDRLIFGASRLIREADVVVPGKKIRVHANRGLAGIDGTIATATGIALALGETAGVTRVVLGDLAALHDAGAMLYGVGEPRPRLQVIVGNDGGGSLFESLEVAATAPAAAFERVLRTPQLVDFAALAAAYGWEYRLVTNRGELDEALSPSEGTVLIEVPLSD